MRIITLSSAEKNFSDERNDSDELPQILSKITSDFIEIILDKMPPAPRSYNPGRRRISRSKTRSRETHQVIFCPIFPTPTNFKI